MYDTLEKFYRDSLKTANYMLFMGMTILLACIVVAAVNLIQLKYFLFAIQLLPIAALIYSFKISAKHRKYLKQRIQECEAAAEKKEGL